MNRKNEIADEHTKRFRDEVMRFLNERCIDETAKMAIIKLADDMNDIIAKDDQSTIKIGSYHPLDPIKGMIINWLKRYRPAKRAGILALRLAERGYDQKWLEANNFSPGLFNPRQLGRWISNVMANEVDQKPIEKPKTKNKPATRMDSSRSKSASAGQANERISINLEQIEKKAANEIVKDRGLLDVKDEDI